MEGSRCKPKQSMPAVAQVAACIGLHVTRVPHRLYLSARAKACSTFNALLIFRNSLERVTCGLILRWTVGAESRVDGKRTEICSAGTLHIYTWLFRV